MRKKRKEDRIELVCRVGPMWVGPVSDLAKGHTVPDGYKLDEVRREGCKYTFVYVSAIPKKLP